MQNDLPMTIDTSKSKPEVQFQYGAVPFPKPEVVLSQPALSYLIEIWYANSYPPS